MEDSKRSRPFSPKPNEENQPKLGLNEMIPIFWRLPTMELVRFVSNQPKHPLGRYWSAGLKFVMEKRLPLSLKTSITKDNASNVIYDCSGSKVADIKHHQHFHLSPLCELIEQVELPFRFPKKYESEIMPIYHQALSCIRNSNTLRVSLVDVSNCGGGVLRVFLDDVLAPDITPQLTSVSLCGYIGSTHDGLGDLVQLIARATSLRKLRVDERQALALLLSSGASDSTSGAVLAGLETLSISRGQAESYGRIPELLGGYCTRLCSLELPLRGPISDYFAAVHNMPNMKELGLDAELIPASRLHRKLVVDDGVAAITSVSVFRWHIKAYTNQDEAILLAVLSKLPNVRSFEVHGCLPEDMLRLASAVCSHGVFSHLQTLMCGRGTDTLSIISFSRFISANSVNLPSTIDLSQVRMPSVRGAGSDEFLVEVFRAMAKNGVTSLLFRAIVQPQAVHRFREYLESTNSNNAKRASGLNEVLTCLSDKFGGGCADFHPRGHCHDLQFTDLIKSSGRAKGLAFTVRLYLTIIDAHEIVAEPESGRKKDRCRYCGGDHPYTRHHGPRMQLARKRPRTEESDKEAEKEEESEKEESEYDRDWNINEEVEEGLDSLA